MLQKQKEIVLSLIKSNYGYNNFIPKYLLPYKDFMNSKEDFTEFNCERDDGKAQYLFLIEQLLIMDKNTQVFVEVYGLEEDVDDTFIYADTLIIISELLLSEVEHIFNAAVDLFPSDIGEITDSTDYMIIIYKDGTQHLIAETLSNLNHIYYCWWD